LIFRDFVSFDFISVQAFENLKHRAKKTASNRRVEVLKTGGGPVVPQLDVMDEKILQLLGNRAVPLGNEFDSDAAYNTDIKGIYNHGSGN